MLRGLFDCHMHSTHSHDAKATFEELCESAINCGLQGIYVTEHADFDKLDPGYGNHNYEAYMADVNKYRKKYKDKLIIKSGVEITYQTEFIDDIKDFLNTYKFDHVIGAVHLIDHIFVLNPKYPEGRSEKEAFEPYWEESLAMAKSGLFECIGHFDYIKSIRTEKYGDYKIKKWLPYITEILKKIIESGSILEVNTSAYRRGHLEPYPGWDILRLYKDLGGTNIVLGSDAHSPSYVGLKFRETAAKIREIGLNIGKNDEF